ncbi:MAG TPA: hypothetical protein VE987_03795 [Polyangiaceae bacterium]|nr:hypothetical protein [Polyangiaceae bacterium]
MFAARTRLVRLVFVAAAIALALLLSRHWPKDQAVHYVLGDAAPLVLEVDARWASGDPREPEDWSREATFRYAPGAAPRIVTHDMRLPDGDYTVEIEVASGPGSRPATHVVRRRVTLSGGAVSIDLQGSLVDHTEARRGPR